MKYEESACYYEGYSAHRIGIQIGNCRFDLGSPERLEWCSGWRDSENDCRKGLVSNQNDNTNQQFESLAAKPVGAWNGDGLPPVGTECEWLASGDHDWIGVKVLAYHEDEVWLQPLNGAQSFTVGNPDDFRPLSSKEERKSEEAKNVIAEIFRSSASNGHSAELIYDAIAAGKIPHIKLESADE